MVCVWFINMDEIPVEYQSLEVFKDLISAKELQKVLSFHFKDDQYRSLISILLQKKLIRSTWGIDNKSFSICRTKENKPFMTLKTYNSKIGLWNYNVSHHGKFIGIGSHSSQLIGVDIVDTSQRSNLANNFDEFINMFNSEFHYLEITRINKEITEDNKYKLFYILWALKETYIKAIGTGLSFPLNRIRFEIQFNKNNLALLIGSAQIYVDNILLEKWRFSFQIIEGPYVLAIALGPCDDACNSFKDTFICDNQLQEIHNLNYFDSSDVHVTMINQKFDFLLS